MLISILTLGAMLINEPSYFGETREFARVGSWVIMKAENACEARTPNGSGSISFGLEGPEGRLTPNGAVIALPSRNFRLPDGEYSVDYTFGPSSRRGTQRGQTRGAVSNEFSDQIYIPAPRRIIADIFESWWINFSIGPEIYRINMIHRSEAFRMLELCLDHDTNPFASRQ